MILDFLAALLLFALLILSNTSIEGNMDFLPIYVGASSMLKNYSPYSAEGILLYLYPPWYALGTFFLGFFSLKMAATVWFSINIFLLLYSVRLIVEPMEERKIKIAQMLSILFLPILGVLVVGQFVIPVICGVALLLSGIRTQSKAKLSFSLIFITLKPHLVILIVASAIYYYYLSSKGALYKLFIPYILPFLLTLLLSFILFPTWPMDYVGSLYQFRNTSIFSQCKNCMSLTRMISSGFNINADFLFAIALILSFLTITRIKFSEMARYEKIIVINLAVSLLISSYVRNYDYALLIVPLVWLLFRLKKTRDVIILTICYLAPYISLLDLNQNIDQFVFVLPALLIIYLLVQVNGQDKRTLILAEPKYCL